MESTLFSTSAKIDQQFRIPLPAAVIAVISPGRLNPTASAMESEGPDLIGIMSTCDTLDHLSPDTEQKNIPYVRIYPKAGLSRTIEALSSTQLPGMPGNRDNNIQLLRLASLTKPITIDSSNRITLPVELRAHLSIKPGDEIALIVLADHLELYTPENLKEVLS
jgi:AbrB family looped-hinge helix DNA binding protein